MTRVLSSTLAALYIPLVAWAMGSDFERGSLGVLFVLLFSPFAFGAVYSIPDWRAP